MRGAVLSQEYSGKLMSLDDEKLASLVKDENDEAFEVLTSRYMKLISSVAVKYKEISTLYDITDFTQEGLLGLYLACKTYSKDKDSNFKNYLMICVENRYISIVRSLSKKANIPDSSLKTIDLSLDDTSDNTQQSIQENLESKEYIQSVNKTLKDKLSDLEYNVVKMYLSGMSYKEIAKSLSITDKAVDNSLQRIHKKLNG